MPAMPLHVERGAHFAALERLASDRSKLIAARAALRRPGVDLADVLDFAPVDTATAGHLRAHWFGTTASPGGPVQPPFSAGNRTTGFWAGYHGDTHEIVRLTLHTAIDVALGIEWDTRNAEVDARARAVPKPTMFLWVCPSPWFSGYVCWTDRQVTVVFHTPANGDPVDVEFATSPDLDTRLDHGHIVINHQTHHWWAEGLHVGTPLGDVLVPVVDGVRGVGPVVRQQERDVTRGGVDPHGGPVVDLR